jgi:hypothetical protein
MAASVNSNWAQVKRFLSDDHFSVDGTLFEAWASLKSFRTKDGAVPGSLPPGINWLSLARCEPKRGTRVEARVGGNRKPCCNVSLLILDHQGRDT